MQFTMELDVTVEADSAEEAETEVLKALGPISVVCDITEGPNEVVTDEEDEDTEEVLE